MSVAPTSASTSPFEFALIGNLRPWEVEDCARKVVDRETAQRFVAGLHDHIVRRIDRRPKPSDIEYIVRIAAEAYEILGEYRGAIGDISDKDVVWSIFVRAMGGVNIVELERFASRQIQEADAASASIKATTKLVKSYVSKNHIEAKRLASLVTGIHSVLGDIKEARVIKGFNIFSENPTAEQIQKSISPEGIISFLDGKSYKSLRYHLLKNGLSPDDYKKQFNLPSDYPMAIERYNSKKTRVISKISDRSKTVTVRQRATRQVRSG